MASDRSLSEREDQAVQKEARTPSELVIPQNEAVADEIIDPRAEATLRLKIDLAVVPTVAVLYLLCFIDRANIGNAKIAGLDKDLGLKGSDYNVVLSSFYVGYILFEMPSTLMCKKVGPGWWIPAITLLFGVLSLCTAFVHNRAQACGVRFLLGMMEAGMMPGIAYYLSRWYRRAELAFRLSLYLVMSPLAGAFGGLLASAILKLDHFAGLHSWRMIFAIEGLVTIGLAMMSFFTLTDRPETARWLTPAERQLALTRVKVERVGVSEVLDRVDRTKLLRGIVNPVVLAVAFGFLLNNVTVQGLAFFLPTIVKTIYPKESTIMQQLHTVPPYLVGAFFVLSSALGAWRLNRRQIFILAAAPFVMTGYILFLTCDNPHLRYGATFLIVPVFISGALSNAQVSANVVSDTARSAAIGVNVLLGNVGGLISTWTFLERDGPNYPIANGLNLGTSALVLLLTSATIIWTTRDNKARDAGEGTAIPLAQADSKWSSKWSSSGRDNLDWRNPEFRWGP